MPNETEALPNGYAILSEYDERFKETPIIVSCSHCTTTMWALSNNAIVDLETQKIFCRSCIE